MTIVIESTSSRISEQLRDIYSLYRYSGMLLHINIKFTVGKFK